jgi:hypothetical protein
VTALTSENTPQNDRFSRTLYAIDLGGSRTLVDSNVIEHTLPKRAPP